MSPSPQRVAYKYLMADAVQDAASAKGSLDAVGRALDDLRLHAELMERLIAKGEARRLGRTSDIRLRSVKFDGKRITADVAGTTADYDTRITVSPPGHHCTCPDYSTFSNGNPLFDRSVCSNKCSLFNFNITR